MLATFGITTAVFQWWWLKMLFGFDTGGLLMIFIPIMVSGILIDAFAVRMALVPAVMAIFGEKAWWLPKRLDRILPNLDVEGDKLITELKASDGKPCDQLIERQSSR